MNIEDILILPGDLPAWNVAGEKRLVTGDHPVLQNIGGAEFLLDQWIGNIERRGEIGGGIHLYAYPSESAAEAFFSRFTKEFHAQPLAGVGNRAFIHQVDVLPPMPPSTHIDFRRGRFVVHLHGTENDDPSFARSQLSREVLIRYAQLLDRRLIENAAQSIQNIDR